MPYGSNLVSNGAFTSNTTGWDAGTGATLASVGSGQSGNCLRITCDGTGNRFGSQTVTVVSGAIYHFTCYFKKGTADHGRIRLGSSAADGVEYYDSGDIDDAAWTQYTTIFTATNTTCYVTFHSREANNTALYDTVVLRNVFTVGGELHMATGLTLD